MCWQNFKGFMVSAFSENGQPSSSRILSAVLSVWSMAVISWSLHHALKIEDPAKLLTWVGGLPAIIYALATFAVSPYGLTKITGIWNKDKREDEHQQ